MYGRFGHRVVRVGAFAAALLAGAAAAGYAANALTAPSTTVIQACRNSENGLLRMLAPTPPSTPQHGEDAKAATSCKKDETPVSWNVVGPVGPQGATGATGPAGPQGPPGPHGTGGALTSFDSLNNTDCTLDLPGAPSPIPGKISITWTVNQGQSTSLAGWSATPSFTCSPVIAPPPPAPCPTVPNGTATCAANDGVVTSVVCDTGYYQPVGRDPGLGCAPNSRTNATQATAVDLGTVTCGGPALPPINDSIAGVGDEAWYVVHISIVAGCPSMAGATWTNPSGTLSYDIYGSLGGGALTSFAVNQMSSYPLTSLGFPPGVTGTVDAYIRVHEAGTATTGGAFTVSLLTQ